ncbi:cytadherence high molecular weight protein 1 [Micropterus salmoides]|uniref:cytadherence high molecular weight protein 1 n=1 Tax=Micropterus salmoides TaxID=27706 RepID=UPI0018ECA09E|nr:cytadherence high molecular weight protein 1 [Micropterus salmoides]
MKTLALLSLSLAVALGMPPFAPGVEQKPVLNKEEQSPLLGDLVPEQGHVVVEDPLPQVRLGSKEQQEKLAPVPADMEQSLNMVELEVKVKPDFKAEPEVKVEQEGKEHTEDKVEEELEAETEVKEEPDVKMEHDVKGDLEVNPEINLNPEVMAKLEVKVESDSKENTDVKVEQELKAEPEVQEESDVKVDLEANVDPEINLNPEVMAELEVKVEPEVEVEPELKDDPDFKVESEVKVDPDEATEPEERPLFNEEEVQEEFQVQMSLEPESETGREFEERHIDTEGKYEMVGEPIMELEPLDDNNMFEEELGNTELSEVEMSMRAAVQNQYQPLPEEEVMGEQEYILNGEPIMELEPEAGEDSFLHQQVMQDATVMEEGPALDIMGRRMRSVEEYFPNEEARMGMEPGKLQDYLMMEEPETFREERFSPVLDDNHVLDGDAQIDVAPVREKMDLTRQGVKNPEEETLSATGPSCYPGVVLERKCYQFFQGPKRAADAQLFCQEHFPGGHLASITSPHIHREVMKMMLRQNGEYIRTWIGGLRYLDTGRFVWLDGSHWSYADWLSGEPNNTAAVENCVEVLGNGKFNDFTCWEPQAFICSHPY